MRTAEYNRCAVKGCAYLLRAPLTHCRDHAAEAMSANIPEALGLMVD